jgi:hypothetical protein
MRQVTPWVALFGLLLVGCAGHSGASKPIDPDLYQVTIEVTGMT